LKSVDYSSRYYIGITTDLEDRLKKHNSGKCKHTAKFQPWSIDVAIAFHSKKKAIAFEKYLKTHSGRAFAKKHF
jgi:predicted GIY-YIG superfamily endonuclease